MPGQLLAAAYNTGELMNEGAFDVGRKTGEWMSYAPGAIETKRKTCKGPTLPHLLQVNPQRSRNG